MRRSTLQRVVERLRRLRTRWATCKVGVLLFDVGGLSATTRPEVIGLTGVEPRESQGVCLDVIAVVSHQTRAEAPARQLAVGDYPPQGALAHPQELGYLRCGQE